MPSPPPRPPVVSTVNSSAAAQAETDLAVEAQKRAADWIPKVLYFAVLGYIATRIISFASDYFGTIMNFDSYMK